MKFKAAILTELNKPLEILEVSPCVLKYGQVLVKITKSGLCGAQLQEISGEKGNSKFLPHLLGHEGCGVVEEFGEGVKKVKVGDKVVLHWRKGSGIESDSPNYLLGDKTISSGKITTLSEYSIVSENRVTPVDSNLSEDFCALLGCGLSTGFSAVNKEANIKFGETVLILGCGGVGLNCILAANLSQATVIGIDIEESKKIIVESLGAKFYLLDKVSDFLIKNKIDCIIDTTGILGLVSRYLPLLSESGRVILLSQPKLQDNMTILDPMKFFGLNGITIKTTQAGGFSPDIDIPRYTKLYLDKKLGSNIGNV